MLSNESQKKNKKKVYNNKEKMEFEGKYNNFELPENLHGWKRNDSFYVARLFCSLTVKCVL